ncbi:hypothetical protein ACG2LH_11495 [Zhouia sp. PK063]|uniref:hypothetical protein n=1 Tax=Zhouia sp. PK063 TaxID=3373602 RepID=UPI0037899648
MRIFKISLAITLISTLFSCDPSGDYQYWIENNSDSTLFLEYKELYNDSIFVEQINLNTKVLIRAYGSINGIHDYGDNFLNRYFETFQIFTDSINGTLISKNPTIRNNWNYDIKKTGSFGISGINIYTFKIQNKDL